MKRIIPLLILGTLLSGCSQREPAATAQDDHLIDLYADLIILHEQSKLDSVKIDSNAYSQKVERLLLTHGFTKEQLYSQIEAQLQTPESFRQFYDSLHARLEEKRTKTR